MKNYPITTPKLLLLCLTAIGSSAALAQQLGAIPVAVAANPAFIQAGQSGMAAQAVQTAPQAVAAAPVVSSTPAAVSPATTLAKQAAQTDEKANDKAKSVIASNPQPAEKSTPDTPPKGEVNPMTGKVADIETLTLTYEREKLLAAIATEKQKRLTAERTANDQAMPTPPSGPMKAPLVGPAGANPGAASVNAQAAAPVKPVKVARIKPVPVMPAMPMLAGTMMQNGERYAIIEQSGESVVVKQGQTAFGQAVGRISESSVSLGGMMLSAQAPSVMRVARNDMPVGGASVGGTQSVAGNGPMPAPLSGVNPSLPLTIPTQGQAPTNTAMMPQMGIPATGSGVGR